MHAVSKRLTKQCRLTKPFEYQHVFGDAKKIAGNGFTALVRANELGEARLGLIISKKCSKKAVLRNRIKRIIRESFRLNRDMIGEYDIIIIGRPGMGKKTGLQLRVILSRLWKELG